MARLKEINRKYVAEDICMAIIPTVLRKPDVGEQQQAVTTGVIIGWMASRTGMNREYTPQKVNAAMKKLQFKPKKTNKGNVYFVVRLLADDLKHAGELLANQEFKKEVEADIPFWKSDEKWRVTIDVRTFQKKKEKYNTSIYIFSSGNL